jgi:hypothetical protein
VFLTVSFRIKVYGLTYDATRQQKSFILLKKIFLSHTIPLYVHFSTDALEIKAAQNP